MFLFRYQADNMLELGDILGNTSIGREGSVKMGENEHGARRGK